MKDYYDQLGLTENATLPDIRKAYRRLAKKYHPDVNKSDIAHEKFIEITEAYEFLIDHHERRFNTSSPASQSREDREPDDWETEQEKFRQMARDRAQQRAKMRYEEFIKREEAYRESGMNDIALLFKIIIRIGLIPLFLFFLFLPVYIAWYNEWTMIFLFVVTWPFAGIIAWYIRDNKKKYFMPGAFYYTWETIKKIYTERNPTGQKCYYCPSKPADSKSYKIDLLRLRDLKMKTRGYHNHTANYINQNITIQVPRSRKAFIIHTVIVLIKLLSLIFCLAFLNTGSLVWRIIIGMVVGGMISLVVLALTHTKSNVSYLISYGSVFRAGQTHLKILIQNQPHRQ